MNILTVILATEPGIFYKYWSSHIEFIGSVALVIFSIELFFRLISQTCRKRITSYLIVLDIVVILVIFYSLIYNRPDLRLVIVLRILNIFRIPKYEESLLSIVYILKKRKNDLITIWTFFVIIIVLSSWIMYLVEGPLNTDFDSIPRAIWWSIMTFSTVGYGDVYPITSLGKTIGGALSLVGVTMFGIIISILSVGFLEEIRSISSKDKQ